MLTAPTMVAAAMAFVATLLCTCVVRRYAPRYGLVDKPDGRRKMHHRTTPLGGGLAVFLGALAATFAAAWLDQPTYATLLASLRALKGLGAAAAIIVIVGLLDDRFGLRGRQKLAGQLLAAASLVAGGLTIRHFTLFDCEFELGIFAIPFTMFWLLGAINAINLIDGSDGLATSVGLVQTVAIAALALVFQNHAVVLIAAILAGALAGFLPYNYPPATIFLGDAGSMLIGLVVGALSILGTLKSTGTAILAAPLAICAIPLFDSIAAIVRRKLTGRSIYNTDRAHLHHCLQERLGSNRKVLCVVAVACGLTSLSALASVYWKNDSIAIASTIAVLSVFVFTGLFGRAEAALLCGFARRALNSLFRRFQGERPAGTETTIRLQGSRSWELLWTTLLESVDKLSLSALHLDVNLPALREGFHASWESPRALEPDYGWRMEFPLMVSGQRAGRLTVVGEQSGTAACEDLEKLIDLLSPFETQFVAISSAHADTVAMHDGEKTVRSHGRTRLARQS